MQKFAATKKEIVAGSAAKRIFGSIKNEMLAVEAEYERQARSNIQVIGYLGDYLRSSGGKRIRPALTILTSAATSDSVGIRDNIIRMATVMEMIHTATLVHDDIIDNADLRRNKPSINARFGNQAAVLMGDWLYMSAFETALGERSLEILEVLTSLTRKMTEGELIQMTLIGRLDIHEDAYFDILKRKTAYLFSACCEIGAIMSGASRAVQEAMRDFGLQLGIAFQLADDLLDLTGDAETIGKAAGADLLEGKITLPLIKLLKAQPELKADFEQILLSGEYSELSRETLVNSLENHNITAEIRDLAGKFALDARKNLDVLLKTEYRTALEAITDYVIVRNK